MFRVNTYMRILEYIDTKHGAPCPRKGTERAVMVFTTWRAESCLPPAVGDPLASRRQRSVAVSVISAFSTFDTGHPALAAAANS